MPGLVSIIQSHPEQIGIVLTGVNDPSGDILERRQISRVWSLLALRRFRIGINRKQIDVFVAIRIFNKQNVLSIFSPGVSVQRSFAISQRTSIFKRLGKFFHPHIHDALIRLHERNELAVRAQLTAGNLWISKKELPIQ